MFVSPDETPRTNVFVSGTVRPRRPASSLAAICGHRSPKHPDLLLRRHLPDQPKPPPLELFAFDINDRIVLGFLTLITLIALFVAGVWSNVFISVAIGAVLACVHAAMRAPEDQEASPYENLLSVVDSPTRGDYARV
nr:PRA1 family protein D-like [Ipomoea batatas]